MLRSLFAALFTAGLAGVQIAQASTLNRPDAPVVMTGTDLPTFLGLAVDQIVAFRYDDGWQQIPVQIDERKVVDYRDVYGGGIVDPGFTTLAYADPNTYCGADSDPTFDTNDELVFMAKDAGDHAGPGSGRPAGVISGSGLELMITDSLDSGVGYVYLFRTDGSLTPDAGQDYVTYEFNFLGGEYIPDYDLADGPNPENSSAYTAYYRTHFADRWICDEVNVYAGTATGVDILDRHKNLFVKGNCSRTENSFSDGEGAFFVNKDGAVRALRSYMGANSGPLTQRVHRFYEQRQEVTTHLRVHVIIGMMDLYDYSPDASGMYYYNDQNTGGLLIDGVPDSPNQQFFTWEMVTGAQGSLLISHQLVTDVSSYSYFLWYSDDMTPAYTQCTGDAYEYGESGIWIPQPIPNTDPLMGEPVYIVAPTRVIRYATPGQTVQAAGLHHDQVSTPLGVTTATYQATHTLTLTLDNEKRGDVDLDPPPDDPNLPAYAPGTNVTLTAQPIEGRSFAAWTIFDPNYPGDSNYGVEDTNTVLVLTMDMNQYVHAAFKCGSSGIVPLVGAVAFLTTALLVRRRG